MVIFCICHTVFDDDDDEDDDYNDNDNERMIVLVNSDDSYLLYMMIERKGISKMMTNVAPDTCGNENDDHDLADD